MQGLVLGSLLLILGVSHVSAGTVASVAIEFTTSAKDATPGITKFTFTTPTKVQVDEVATITCNEAIFKASYAANNAAISALTSDGNDKSANTPTFGVDTTGKIGTLTVKTELTAAKVQVLTIKADTAMAAKLPATQGVVSCSIVTTADTTAGTGKAYVFDALLKSLFLDATFASAAKYIKSEATPGALTFVIVPQNDIAATKILTITASAAIFKASQADAAGTVNTKTDKSEGTLATDATGKILTVTMKTGKTLTKLTEETIILDSAAIAANSATLGPVTFSVQADGGDTAASTGNYGYTIMNADKTAYLNSADVTTKTTGVAPGKLTVQFTPFTSVVGNAAKKTVTITSDKAIFGANKAPTVACKSTKNEYTVAVTCTSASDATGKILTVTATTANEEFTAQELAQIEVSTELVNNGAVGVVQFKIETAEDTTASALKDGYTIVAAPASSASANTTTASAAAATGTETTVTQEYTFASITAAQYTGDMKSNCECAYANTVEAATTPTWCVATTSAYTYKSGVAMSSSAAARRAAKVTFVLKVKSSVKTTSQLQTMVASGSTATNFAAALAAVNTASNKTVAPGTATVATATFTGGSSSASTLLPSMLSLVAAIFVAARQ